MLMSLQFQVVLADDYFNTIPKVKLYKIGYYKDFQGKLIKIENLKMNKVKQQNSNISEYRFHRLDSKVFSSIDLKEWNEIKDFNEINSSYSFNTNIHIYPNPVIENLMIYSNEGEKFEIYSILGVKIIEGIVKPQIDVKYLDQGIYFLKIKNNIQKFVKI